MNPIIRNLLIGGAITIALIVLLAWPTKPAIPVTRSPKRPIDKPQPQVNQANKRFPCVSTMDPTYFKRFTELAKKYDQTAFDHLVIPRLRYHFDERFVSKFLNNISSSFFVLAAIANLGSH